MLAKLRRAGELTVDSDLDPRRRHEAMRDLVRARATASRILSKSRQLALNAKPWRIGASMRLVSAITVALTTRGKNQSARRIEAVVYLLDSGSNRYPQATPFIWIRLLNPTHNKGSGVPLPAIDDEYVQKHTSRDRLSVVRSVMLG